MNFLYLYLYTFLSVHGIASVDAFLFSFPVVSPNPSISNKNYYIKKSNSPLPVISSFLSPSPIFISPTIRKTAIKEDNQENDKQSSSESKDWALIFDCDGVILESEGLHRDAYNKMFQEFSIDYRWSETYYDELQNLIGGGIPKMRYYFNLHGWPSKIKHESLQINEEYSFNVENVEDPEDLPQKTELLNILQDRKTIIYKDFISGGVATVRPGFKRVVSEAVQMAKNSSSELKSKPKLAICSASTKSSCLFVLDNLLGEKILKDFDLILAGDDVANRKPHPEIYELACDKLEVTADQCIVVEDSLIGLQAAVDAKMKCVITHTPSTASQDFLGNGAIAVYPELGDETVYVTAEKLAEFVFNK